MSIFGKKEQEKPKFEKINNESEEVETSPMQTMIDKDTEEQEEINKSYENKDSESPKEQETKEIKTQFIEVTSDQLINLKLDRILELLSRK